MRLIVFIILLTVFFKTKLVAQENQAGIKRNFNYIEYYPDSTIKRALNFENYEPVGYCIVFDNMGNPITIGEYKSWNRFGEWLNSDGTTSHYTDNVHYTRFVPGCGTGKWQNIEQFNELYEQLTR